MVAFSPWLSSLRGLAAEGVTLVFCEGLVGLPSWGCGASGFLGPAVFMVFAMRSPISGRDCVLPQSAPWLALVLALRFPLFAQFLGCTVSMVSLTPDSSHLAWMLAAVAWFWVHHPALLILG